MKQAFIAVVGHNAAGKTTLSKQIAAVLNLNRVNADEIRQFIIHTIPYFADVSLATRTPKYDQLNNFAVRYRFDMAYTLLEAGQSVIYDGSGTDRQSRDVYLRYVKDHFPQIQRIIIYCEIDEQTLLERLKERDAIERNTGWQDQYWNIKKQKFQPPSFDEADALLVYDQTNESGVMDELRTLLH